MGKVNCKIRALQYINRLIVEYGSLSIKVLVELNISFFLRENQRNFNIIIIIIIVRYEIWRALYSAYQLNWRSEECINKIEPPQPFNVSKVKIRLL